MLIYENFSFHYFFLQSFNISRSNNGSPFEFTKTKMSGLSVVIAWCWHLLDPLASNFLFCFRQKITDDSFADGMASADIFDNSSMNSSTSAKQMSIVARAKQALFAPSSASKDTFNMDLFEDIGSELYLDGKLININLFISIRGRLGLLLLYRYPLFGICSQKDI